MTTALQLVGAALITAGATLIYIPAGLIVGGTFAILIGLALGRK
jgi:hypothetical protein